MNSAFVGVAIGMVIIFAVLAAASSAVTEGIARLIGLRGEYLLRGLRTLIDNNSTFKTRFRLTADDKDSRQLHEAELTRPSEQKAGAKVAAAGDISDEASVTGTGPGSKPRTPNEILIGFLSHPLVQAQGNNGTVERIAGSAPMTSSERRNLPSYLSAHTFATAIIDTVVPDSAGTTTIDQLKAELDKLPEGTPLKQALVTIASQAGTDIADFRVSLERWYDDHMKRVSGWYKRHVRWVSLAVAAALVVIFNLGAVRIASALYLDGPLRAAVVNQTAKIKACESTETNTCLELARREVVSLEASGLPIGWSTSEKCAASKSCNWFDRYGFTDPGRDGWHNFGHVLLVLLGYLLMIAATLPGARFWFDALSRLNSLRSTGPKP